MTPIRVINANFWMGLMQPHSTRVLQDLQPTILLAQELPLRELDGLMTALRMPYLAYGQQAILTPKGGNPGIGLGVAILSQLPITQQSIIRLGAFAADGPWHRHRYSDSDQDCQLVMTNIQLGDRTIHVSSTHGCWAEDVARDGVSPEQIKQMTSIGRYLPPQGIFGGDINQPALTNPIGLPESYQGALPKDTSTTLGRAHAAVIEKGLKLVVDNVWATKEFKLVKAFTFDDASDHLGVAVDYCLE